MRLKAPPRPKTISPFGVSSFTLGSATFFLCCSAGYHPFAWTMAYAAMGIAVIALLASTVEGRTGWGWPIAGFLASLLCFRQCYVMEKHEDRVAYEAAGRKAILEEAEVERVIAEKLRRQKAEAETKP